MAEFLLGILIVSFFWARYVVRLRQKHQYDLLWVRKNLIDVTTQDDEWWIDRRWVTMKESHDDTFR